MEEERIFKRILVFMALEILLFCLLCDSFIKASHTYNSKGITN